MNPNGDYVLVAVLGILVGASELVSRYRDAPWRAVTNRAAFAYVGVNVAATVSALIIVRVFGLELGGQSVAETRVLQILVAGFGAIAFFRTSLFIVRVGGRDIAVGPATLLQVLLAATDREVDRLRAVERAQVVGDALQGLSFTQISGALPRYCLTLMQNVAQDERAELEKQVDEIRRSEMEDTLKVNALGLALTNVVGQKVLKAAARSVRTRLLEHGVLGNVYPRLREVIEQDASQSSVDVLGLTLYTAWPQIRMWLVEPRSPLAGRVVRLRVLDPAFVRAHQDAWFDEAWAPECERALEEVRAHHRSHAQALRDLGTTLTASTYSMMPAFHGFRVGGAYFVSMVHWDAETGRVARPHYPYEYFAPEDASSRAHGFKTLFDNWLARADAEEAPRPDGRRPDATTAIERWTPDDRGTDQS